MSFSRTRLIIIYDLFGWIWLYSFHAAYKFWTHWLCGRAAMWWLLNMALQQCVVLFGSGEPIVHSSRACICVCVREGERGIQRVWRREREIDGSKKINVSLWARCSVAAVVPIKTQSIIWTWMKYPTLHIVCVQMTVHIKTRWGLMLLNWYSTVQIFLVPFIN